MRLAVKLGLKEMVLHIVHTQVITEWVWGPVTCFHLDLAGIDSLGTTNNDVMELVAQMGALKETQALMMIGRLVDWLIG